MFYVETLADLRKGNAAARQTLRFLLADDPGAGRPIMAALLMKEMIARGDLQRCVCFFLKTHVFS